MVSFLDLYCGVFAALSLALLFGRVPVGVGSVVLVAATSASMAVPFSGGAKNAIEQLQDTHSACDLPPAGANLQYLASLAGCYLN